MLITDIVFDDFFSRPLPHEGFEISPSGAYPGLITPDADDYRMLHGFEVTMEGDVIVPQLRPAR